jgi:predicted GH43/DUF377 family glycosyl hydrolase
LPLGIFRDNDAVGIIGREKYSTTYKLVSGHGHGLAFQLREESPSIVLPLGRKEHLGHISDVRMTQVLDQRIMTYTAEDDGVRQIRIALRDADEEMDVWDVPSLNRHLTGSGMLVPDYMHDGQYVLIYGERELRVAFSKNLVAWHAGGQILASRSYLPLISTRGCWCSTRRATPSAAALPYLSAPCSCHAPTLR